MELISKITSKIIKFCYKKTALGIRTTPPITNLDSSSNVILLSMVQHSDVDMLLVAIKSFCRFVPVREFVIVADPSLTTADKEILRQHLKQIRFIDADVIAEDQFPRGGCWERILGISSLNNDSYVIQLDADTITLSKPSQVLECVANNKAFTLSTKSGTSVSSVEQSTLFAKERQQAGATHIQISCEALLDQAPNTFTHYVRGCAGFAGFAPGDASYKKLADINQFFSEKLQHRWSEWGSEQFASNLLVANAANPEMLALDQYDVPLNRPNLAFHHYIGTMRFANLTYIKNTRQIIRSLSLN